MKKLIVFDGCDGVGKTSCALALAKEMDAMYYKTPPKIFDSIRVEIESFNDYDLRFHFYLTAMLYAAKEIEALLKNTSVICDRYIYSTIAYHRAIGIKTPENLEKLFPQPDYAFLLHAQDEVIKKRLSERSVFGFFDTNFEIQKKAFKEFQSFNLNLFETSYLKVEESVEQLFKKIHQ